MKNRGRGQLLLTRLEESVAHPEVYPACPEHLGGALGRGKGDSVGSASVIG